MLARPLRLPLKHVTGFACLVALAALAGVALAAPGAQTKRSSVNSNGAQGNSYSSTPAMSPDGRLVVFGSNSSNLVSGDTNGTSDIFVRDRQTHKTRRVSVSSTGAQGDGSSSAFPPTISSDGRYVTFTSIATNLVSGDTNGSEDVFVRDLKLHKTKRVSVSSSGAQGNGPSEQSIISSDGGSVIFSSRATNLVAGDTNGQDDIFVRNLKTHTTTRVSVSSTGTQSDGASYNTTISADGHLVGFASDATNLVPGDANAATDAFVRDLKTHKTKLVSVSSGGVRGDALSSEPSISADARYVGFASHSTNLVGGDTNAQEDVFVRDLKLDKTRRVSVSSSGAQGNGKSYFLDPSVSAHGEFVVFVSEASNLVPGDTNATGDDFIRDVANHKTSRLSVGSAGVQGNGYSLDPAITPDGRFVAFESPQPTSYPAIRTVRTTSSCGVRCGPESLVEVVVGRFGTTSDPPPPAVRGPLGRRTGTRAPSDVGSSSGRDPRPDEEDPQCLPGFVHHQRSLWPSSSSLPHSQELRSPPRPRKPSVSASARPGRRQMAPATAPGSPPTGGLWSSAPLPATLSPAIRTA